MPHLTTPTGRIVFDWPPFPSDFKEALGNGVSRFTMNGKLSWPSKPEPGNRKARRKLARLSLAFGFSVENTARKTGMSVLQVRRFRVGVTRHRWAHQYHARDAYLYSASGIYAPARQMGKRATYMNPALGMPYVDPRVTVDFERPGLPEMMRMERGQADYTEVERRMASHVARSLDIDMTRALKGFPPLNETVTKSDSEG